MMQYEQFLKPEQVCEVLQISRNTFCRLANAGRMPGAVRVGHLWRVKPGPFKEFLNNGRSLTAIRRSKPVSI